MCLGFGGKAYGDKNEEIELSRCSPVATADEIDPETLQRPVWGTTWTLPIANEILIGPKNDPACFVVFPGDDSVRFSISSTINIGILNLKLLFNYYIEVRKSTGFY